MVAAILPLVLYPFSVAICVVNDVVPLYFISPLAVILVPADVADNVFVVTPPVELIAPLVVRLPPKSIFPFRVPPL